MVKLFYSILFWSPAALHYIGLIHWFRNTDVKHFHFSIHAHWDHHINQLLDNDNQDAISNILYNCLLMVFFLTQISCNFYHSISVLDVWITWIHFSSSIDSVSLILAFLTVILVLQQDYIALCHSVMMSFTRSQRNDVVILSVISMPDRSVNTKMSLQNVDTMFFFCSTTHNIYLILTTLERWSHYDAIQFTTSHNLSLILSHFNN